MGDTFELLDPRSAQAYLRGFEPANRRQGEIWFRSGRVRDLVPIEAGMAYSAVVEDHAEPGRADVALRYDPAEGWEGDCSCPLRMDCGHVYAAMCALLAEHSTAVVRNLSSGLASPGSGSGRTGTRLGPEEPADLMRALFEALGRPLRSEEKKFVQKISSTYFRCRKLGNITSWDFEQMGLALPPQRGGYGRGTLQIWPTTPATELDFWLYVACAAEEHSVPIPKFIQPITDLTLVRSRLAGWRRVREIDQWKTLLSQPEIRAPVNSRGLPIQVDLRLIIDTEAAVLQWRLGNSQAFETLKPAQVSQIWQNPDNGPYQLTTEGHLFWSLLAQRLYFGSSLPYANPGARGGLGRILRARAIENCVVNSAGQPLARPLEPLRWHLVPAADQHDDYRLSLVQSDGSPLSALLCVFPGQVPLYLTANAVYRGPRVLDEVIGLGGETRIPAPALESAAGVALLQILGIEMPPRIRERIRTLTFQIAIRCELVKVRPTGKSEECLISILAAAPDGHQERFIGGQWVDACSRNHTKGTRRDPSITVYDRTPFQEIVTLLEPLKLKWDPCRSQHSLRATRNFPEQFSSWLKSLPPHVMVQLAGELASFAAGDVAGRVRIEMAEAEIDWFDLRVALQVSDTTLTSEETKLLLNARGRYVRLAGKGWRRLQFDLSPDDDERLARLGLSPREISAEPQRLHALQLSDEAAHKFLPEPQVQHIRRRVSELQTRVVPSLPNGVTAELRPYQLEGFHFLAYLVTNRFGGILADDMGLGKTLQTLAWLVWLREQTVTHAPCEQADRSYPAVQDTPPPPPRASLVICPKSVMDNWQAEAARFTPGLRVRVWHSHELRAFTGRIAEADLHVLNYAQLRLLGKGLSNLRFQAVILDEGQYVKNPGSQTCQVARALCADHRLVLTGTPIENRLLDLWSLMAFAMPGILGRRNHFGRIYDAKGDPLARRRLAARVRPFLLRRTKAQVAQDLPDRIEEDLFCEIEGEQQTLYRTELKRAQQLLLAIKTQQELASQQFHFLVSLLRLRQICCHARLVSPESRAPSAKTGALLELLEPLMEEGHKVLVFSQFVTLLDVLHPVLQARDWTVFYLAGDTENRGDLVRQFQSSQGPAIFLISLKAGGFGLNLTAANYVVLFDPWWNPAVENQAIDRTHRIGQTNKVIAYRLLIKNSIEEKIRQLQKQKKALAQDVLGEERFTQSLTLEDLQFLFVD